MANTTIYPYGTNGELPSSIGLVNDLTTGGVDKALTAEQGKVLRDKIGEDFFVETSSIDLSSLTVQLCGLGGTGWYYSGNKGRHIAYHLEQGVTYILEPLANSGETNCLFGFLTSSYSPPYASGDSIPYASGESRRLITVGNKLKFTPASDWAYLIMTTIDGGGITTSWSLKYEVGGIDETIYEYIGKTERQYFPMTKLNWVDNTGINASTGGTARDTNAICSRSFLPLADYLNEAGELEFVSTSSNMYFFTIALYSSASAGSFIARVGYATSTTISLTAYPTATHFRIGLVYKDSTGTTVVSAGIAKEFELYHLSLKSNATIQSESAESLKVCDTRAEVLHKLVTTNLYVGQGFCKAGQYWVSAAGCTNDSFDAGASDSSYIYIYDSTFTRVGAITHDLGHMSCLSYCEDKDVFLCGNGNAGVSPRIDILLDASTHIQNAIDGVTSEYLFGASDVMSIPLHTSAKDLVEDADGGVCCFGGNDRYIYISIRNSNSAVRTFFKAILGVGTADFSDTGTTDTSAWGTYQSGMTSSQYNGTLKILETYTGESIVSAQGIDYKNGRLILSSNTKRMEISVVNLYGNQYQIERALMISNLAADGSEVSSEPEDLTVTDSGDVYVNTTEGMYQIFI